MKSFLALVVVAVFCLMARCTMEKEAGDSISTNGDWNNNKYVTRWNTVLSDYDKQTVKAMY